MSEVQYTELPGFGERHDFVTEAGDRIGIVTQRDGVRKLVLYDRDDPDSCRTLVKLSAEDMRRLVELVGAS